MKINFMLTLLISAVISFGCSEMNQTEMSASEEFTLRRGLNVSHWLSQSDVRGEERTKYVTEKDFKLISELGFDHVRLPIDEEQMWNENGEKENEAFNLMHNAIKWSFKYNLRVIIDLHVLRSHHFNRPDSRKLWEDKSSQEGFIKFWKELSAELKDYPNAKLAYEPLNEAVSENPEDWNNLINWVISEIRKLEPERTIIMGSNNWQQVGTFKDLKVPTNDKNIILSFHYYEPFILTHYKAEWTDLRNLDADVNYPGTLISNEDYEKMDSEFADRVKNFNQEFDLNRIDKEIKQAVDVAKKYDLQLFCGEFGSYPTTDLELRLKWYKDMITVFKKYNIAWTHWNYKNDFPVINEDMKPIEELLNVLMEK